MYRAKKNTTIINLVCPSPVTGMHGVVGVSTKVEIEYSDLSLYHLAFIAPLKLFRPHEI